MEDEQPAPEFQVVVPPEHKAGVYSNFLGVWHSPYEFTLDFCVTQPPEPSEEHPDRPVMPCEVVSRIKIPVTLIFDVVRALNENMTRYEDAFGEIQRPGVEEDAD
ncbi:MAG: DUF3467 domain-containing protein [Gaiellaceae bacterium]